MLISDLNEFELISILSKVLEQGHASWGASDMHHLDLAIANGDDAAAWTPNSNYEVFTMDTCVENVHFKSEFSSWHDIGWKALASNISDIASMGAQPLYGLVTLGLPPTVNVQDLKEMYQGFADISGEYQMMMVGGDIVKSENVFISISLIGGASQSPLTRSRAKVGDSIILTGPVGSSKGGLLLLQQGLNSYDEHQTVLINKHCKPYPHVDQGLVLSSISNACAMDVSDGVFSDLTKLCESSDCGAILDSESIPIDPELIKCFPDDFLKIAMSGGEDYVLLATVPANQTEKLKQDINVSIIGEITPKDQGIIVEAADGSKYDHNDFLGWDHFR